MPGLHSTKTNNKHNSTTAVELLRGVRRNVAGTWLEVRNPVSGCLIWRFQDRDPATGRPLGPCWEQIDHCSGGGSNDDDAGDEPSSMTVTTGDATPATRVVTATSYGSITKHNQHRRDPSSSSSSSSAASSTSSSSQHHQHRQIRPYTISTASPATPDKTKRCLCLRACWASDARRHAARMVSRGYIPSSQGRDGGVSSGLLLADVLVLKLRVGVEVPPLLEMDMRGMYAVETVEEGDERGAAGVYAETMGWDESLGHGSGSGNREVVRGGGKDKKYAQLQLILLEVEEEEEEDCVQITIAGERVDDDDEDRQHHHHPYAHPRPLPNLRIGDWVSIHTGRVRPGRRVRKLPRPFEDRDLGVFEVLDLCGEHAVLDLRESWHIFPYVHRSLLELAPEGAGALYGPLVSSSSSSSIMRAGGDSRWRGSGDEGGHRRGGGGERSIHRESGEGMEGGGLGMRYIRDKVEEVTIKARRSQTTKMEEIDRLNIPRETFKALPTLPTAQIPASRSQTYPLPTSSSAPLSPSQSQRLPTNDIYQKQKQHSSSLEIECILDVDFVKVISQSNRSEVVRRIYFLVRASPPARTRSSSSAVCPFWTDAAQLEGCWEELADFYARRPGAVKPMYYREYLTRIGS